MYRLGGLKGVEGNQHMGWQGGNVDHGVAGESAGEENVGSCEVVEVVVEEDCRRDHHRLGCRHVRQYRARNHMTGMMPGKMSGVMGLGKKGVWMEGTPALVDGWFERSYGV